MKALNDRIKKFPFIGRQRGKILSESPIVVINLNAKGTRANNLIHKTKWKKIGQTCTSLRMWMSYCMLTVNLQLKIARRRIKKAQEAEDFFLWIFLVSPLNLS